MFLISTFIIQISALAADADSHFLKPFKSDYCTFFPEGTNNEPELWKHCCFEHDLRYWFGGSEGERDVTDQFLKECVHDAAGAFWAGIIYRGVRNGHHSPVQAPTHWGWGWDYKRAMDPLTASEKEYIRSELGQILLDRTFLDQFIIKYKLSEF